VNRPRVILFVGPVFSGKSLFVERLVGAIRSAGFSVSGFFQRGVFDGNGCKIGYDLVGLASGAARPIARLSVAGDRWEFDDAVFETALGEVREGADLVLIDEVGHLEIEGKGHSAAVDRALACSPVTLIVVRDFLADEVTRWLSPRADVAAVHFEPRREARIASELREILSR
jgi:molybdenum cofactor guanylyltransferase